MKYLHSFSKFKLLLEKIQKDQDYYTARLGEEDLGPAVEYFINSLNRLSESIDKDGMPIKEFSDNIREIFFNTFDKVWSFMDDASEIKEKLKDLIKIEPKPIYSESSRGTVVDLTEHYYIIFKNFEGKLIGAHYQQESRKTKPFYQISDKNGNSYWFELKNSNIVGKNFRINKIVGSADKESVVKMIEDFGELYRTKLTPESEEKQVYKLMKAGMKPEQIVKETGIDKDEVKYLMTKIKTQEDIRVLLKKGKSPEEISKILRIDKNKVDKLIDYIEQEDAQKEDEESQGIDLDYKSAQPEFKDPEAKNIFLWGKMIEEFKKVGKEKLRSLGTEEKKVIEFDILVDKFKNILEKNDYKLNNQGGDYKMAICKLVADNAGKIDSPYKEFLSSILVLKVCAQILPKEVKEVTITGVLKDCKDNQFIMIAAPKKSYQFPDFKVISDGILFKRIGIDKIEIKNKQTGATERLKMNSLIYVTGFHFGIAPSETNPMIIDDENSIGYSSSNY